MNIQAALDIIDELRSIAESEHNMSYNYSNSTSESTYTKMIADHNALDLRILELRSAIETNDIVYTA
jgi:hypothetical protein